MQSVGSCLFVFFLVFLVFPWFFAVWPKPREHKTKPKKNKKVQTHGQGLGYPHTNQKTKKQKNKKTKNQETKKPKNQKNKKNQDCTPQGEGVRCRVLGLVFLFFLFLRFLVCVWIAIADVPSRDCQALSVVALEARSIHYSTAMFAVT